MRKLGAAVGLLLLGLPARAADLSEFELRFTYFDQTGRGYQSPAGPASGPGSEDALIYQPQLRARLRDGAWTHDAVLMVDIVSNASTDALDAVSSASALNESFTVDVTSTHAGRLGRASARYGFHLEEPLRSAFAGAGFSLDLADDNATVGASALVMVDSVDMIPYYGGGTYPSEERTTFNINLEGSQILSPTTIADGGYGLTVQTGHLETSYNSVPLVTGVRAGEIFDGTRVRHALRGHIAQHLPATRTSLQGSYRLYLDNYGLIAHTVDVQAFQYLCDWLYLRGSYRLHRQSGVDFFATEFLPMDVPTARTSDSDLAPFFAHELGLKLRLLGERSPSDLLGHMDVEVAVFRYWRSNDLVVNWLGLAVGYRH